MKSPVAQALSVLIATLSAASVANAGEPITQGPASSDKPFSLLGSPLYVEVFGGFSDYPDLGYDGTDYAMDGGVSFGGALGTALTERVDVELELFYTETSYTGYSDEFTSLSVMANGFYNFPLFGALTGYVGAGVGGMNVDYEYESGESDSDWVIAYQATAGVRYPVTEKVAVFAEYRFLGAIGDAELFGDEDAEYKSSNISLGLRFSF